MSANHTPERDAPVADAAPANWVDLYAPAWTRPYLRLARADRPIGTWLLLWPCLWSIGLATPQTGAMYPSLWLMALFAIGAVVMRGAGCTLNDIVDRDIDGKVERTRSRPIPSGAVPIFNAFVFLGLQCLIGLVVLLQLNGFAILLGVASLVPVAIYPFMKRITYWPQIFLGIAINWGALLGWAAVTGSLGLAPILLYVGCIGWTLGYDTIYAHQDKEDDALIGVKSTALKLGEATSAWLWAFYGLAALGLVLAGAAANMGLLYFVGLIFAVWHLARQIARLDISDADGCLELFRSNRDFGIIVFGAVLAGVAGHWLASA